MIIIRKSISAYVLFFQKLSMLLNAHATYISQRRKINSSPELEFEKTIRKIWVKSKPQFGSIDTFYQSNPLIDIKGFRPTISRFKIYDISRFINSETRILDVGGNTGFFSSYVSKFVSHIDVVEFNPSLAKIAELTVAHLKIKNINIVNIDIKEFMPSKDYDLVFSFAIHKWVGESLDSYLIRLVNFLKPNGKIIIESHPGGIDYLELEKAIDRNNELQVIYKDITDDHIGHIRHFYWLQKIEKN
jgi:SAM-dependent methyltransferase